MPMPVPVPVPGLLINEISVPDIKVSSPLLKWDETCVGPAGKHLLRDPAVRRFVL